MGPISENLHQTQKHTYPAERRFPFWKHYPKFLGKKTLASKRGKKLETHSCINPICWTLRSSVVTADAVKETDATKNFGTPNASIE